MNSQFLSLLLLLLDGIKLVKGSHFGRCNDLMERRRRWVILLGEKFRIFMSSKNANFMGIVGMWVAWEEEVEWTLWLYTVWTHLMLMYRWNMKVQICDNLELKFGIGIRFGMPETSQFYVFESSSSSSSPLFVVHSSCCLFIIFICHFQLSNSTVK